jgi:hypothetical protein
MAPPLPIPAAPKLAPAVPRYLECPECNGARGGTIVTLADGETWRDCSACYGRGIIPNPEHQP